MSTKKENYEKIVAELQQRQLMLKKQADQINTARIVLADLALEKNMELESVTNSLKHWQAEVAKEP